MTYFMQENYGVYDSLPCSAAVFLINENLDVIYSNDVFDEMFGTKYISVGDSDRAMFDELLSDASEKPKCIYFKSRNACGKKIMVRAFVIKISNDSAFALFIDDSENAEVIKKLDNKCARYAAAISGTNETFFEYNTKKDCLSVFYSTPDGIVTRETEHFMSDFADNTMIIDSDKNIVKDLIGSNLTAETTVEVRMRMNDDEAYEWYNIIAKPDTRKGVYVGSARNINREKTEEERLKEKALFDPLSKVYNRASAIEKICESLKNHNDDTKCALIVMDIDNFKRINDTFGHLYGDAVIAMAAGSIKSALDNEDIVGRFGGDEFFAFIDNAQAECLEKKLEDIRLSILKMRLDQNDQNDISCSIGVALGDSTSKYEELFKMADSALYDAKKNGKNRFEYFNGTYSDELSISYAGNNDEDESNEAHNVIAIALEIASKSTNAENAISNIMRHIGMTSDLDIIQIFRYDTIEDKIYIEFQWWREINDSYNVVMTEKKVGYYNHNDLMIFRDKFAKDKIFQYTPDFKEGFSQKYYDVFTKSEHINIVHSCNNANENVFYSVAYQTFDKSRVWTEQEFSDMSEITKIISMYLKSSYVITGRELMLMRHIDYDWSGLYSLDKFFEEAGRIARSARKDGKKLGIIHIDVKNLYGINTAYGRGIGDKIMGAVIDLLLNADGDKVIAAHINGTDMMLVMFEGEEKEDTAQKIEKALCEAAEQFKEYTDPPVIYKAALTYCSPGEYIVDYTDAARNAKKNEIFDKTKCIYVTKTKTQYPSHEEYVVPTDKRKK